MTNCKVKPLRIFDDLHQAYVSITLSVVLKIRVKFSCTSEGHNQKWELSAEVKKSLLCMLSLACILKMVLHAKQCSFHSPDSFFLLYIFFLQFFSSRILLTVNTWLNMYLGCNSASSPLIHPVPSSPGNQKVISSQKPPLLLSIQH